MDFNWELVQGKSATRKISKHMLSGIYLMGLSHARMYDIHLISIKCGPDTFLYAPLLKILIYGTKIWQSYSVFMVDPDSDEGNDNRPNFCTRYAQYDFNQDLGQFIQATDKYDYLTNGHELSHTLVFHDESTFQPDVLIRKTESILKTGSLLCDEPIKSIAPEGVYHVSYSNTAFSVSINAGKPDLALDFINALMLWQELIISACKIERMWPIDQCYISYRQSVDDRLEQVRLL